MEGFFASLSSPLLLVWTMNISFDCFCFEFEFEIMFLWVVCLWNLKEVRDDSFGEMTSTHVFKHVDYGLGTGSDNSLCHGHVTHFSVLRVKAILTDQQ